MSRIEDEEEDAPFQESLNVPFQLGEGSYTYM